MMGVLLRQDRHVTVDFLPTLLEGCRRAALDLAVGLVVGAASVVFLFGGWEALSFFRMLNQSSETGLDFPLWWIYAAFPTGFALLLWFSVEKCVLALLELAGDEDRSAALRGVAR
jgi:TRAP-type C4-dicarboxylate transport system permease small subunit